MANTMPWVMHNSLIMSLILSPSSTRDKIYLWSVTFYFPMKTENMYFHPDMQRGTSFFKWIPYFGWLGLVSLHLHYRYLATLYSHKDWIRPEVIHEEIKDKVINCLLNKLESILQAPGMAISRLILNVKPVNITQLFGLFLASNLIPDVRIYLYDISISYEKIKEEIWLSFMAKPLHLLALLVKNLNSYFDRKTYACYVEVPRIFISGNNFQFIPPAEFLENFQCFCISIFRILVTICASMHTYNLVLT